jgi:PAS domain-containing protein
MTPTEYGQLITFVEGSPYPTVLTTYDAANPIIVAANRKHQKLTGFSADELVGKAPRDTFRPLMHNTFKIAEALKNDYYWSGVVWNVSKTNDIQKLHLYIVGVVINHQRYYMAIKRRERKSWLKVFFSSEQE